MAKYKAGAGRMKRYENSRCNNNFVDLNGTARHGTARHGTARHGAAPNKNKELRLLKS